MKLKQLLSVVLMLCMIASSCVGFAAPDYDAKYTTSDVSFGYVDGKVWTDATSLKGGSTVSAKVSASTSGDKENMVFSLFVYKNGKMYDCEVVTKEVGADAVEFVASADVPADSEGCQAVAVLWNNFYDMKMICDSALFPGTNTKLRGLYVDGVLVGGFDPDVTEYSYALASDAQKYPEISWEKADSSAKVTYTKPNSFPGRSVVSVEGAAGEKTEYVVKYVSEVGDFITNIGGMATSPVYVQGGLTMGAKAYNDRQATPTSYIITGIGDPNYEGADLILGSIGWQSDSVFKSTASDWITFDAARGVTVKVLKSDDSNVDHFTKEGWTLETTKLATGFVQTTTNAVKNHKIALSKHFDAGKVSIPAGGSGTTYLVAIMIDPIGGAEQDPDEPVDPDEPMVPEDESLALESISIDGTALEGFNAATNEYTHVLTKAQLTSAASPEVTFTLKDESSTAEVSLPEAFPGSVTITVTNSKEEKAEYVINYDAKNLVTNFVADGESTTQARYIPGGLKVGGNVASDRIGPDQWKITEHAPELEGGDTILTPVVGWIGVVDTFGFDLARSGKITILQNKVNELSKYTDIGFTANADVTSTKLRILNRDATDSREYMFMATKEVEAGSITLPFTKPNMPVLTVFHVDPWSNQATADVSLLLNDIKIDGVSIVGFDKTVNTYNVALTDAQLAETEAPEVTYTLADATSSVTMERPSSFPGSVVITVMGKDDETNTYTINYNGSVVADLALNEAAGTKAPKPQFKTNYKLGDATYADRNNNFLAKHIDDAYLGKDRILYGLGWKNDYDTQYHLAFTGDTIDWVTFTAKRETEVMVFEAANAEAKYAGFKAEYSAEPYIVAQAASNGDLNYKYKYTKTFAAGEKVVLPNVDVANRIGMVVLNYAPWGGFDAEGGDEPVVPPVDPDEPVVPPVDPDEPEEDGLEIMKVKDGKDSIVVFVHDDGDLSTATFLKDEFIENDLKGTVGLIINKINDSNKATWQELFDTGVLNAESHSMTHTYAGQDNTKDETAMVNGVETFIPAGKMKTEIADSKTALKELFPNQNPLVYIRPGVGTITDLQGNTIIATSANAIEMMKENYIAARVTGRTAYTKEGVDTIPPTDYFAMYSIMPGSETTAEEIMESVDEAVEKNGILVFCFHGISDTIANSLTTRKSEADEVFTKVGEYVAEDKVWNPFYSDAVKYMKETETAKATMETTGDAIEVTVTDELDNEIYNYPVTVKVPVPSDWEYALLTQGERTESNLKTFTENGETFVYGNVVPDAGKATVVKSELIVDDLALTEIRIDGNAIKNFKEDVTEYTHSLTPAQAANPAAPQVTWTLADEESTAVVTNPTEFPGSVTITVTNKDNEKRTYTVDYQSDGAITDIVVADSKEELPSLVYGGFKVGSLAYYNRSKYVINEINDESLVGKDFFMGNISWQSNATFSGGSYIPWITFNAQRDVKVTILKTVTAGKDEMVYDGYTYAKSDNANGFVKADTNTAKAFKYAFTKEFEAGAVSIPNGMSANAYLIVFDYAPWGEAEEDDEEESDEPFYSQSLELTTFDGNILVNGSFKANTEPGKGYYVVLESYENGELIKTEKTEKRTLDNGKNTFSIPFNPSYAIQNVKAYVVAEDGTIICEPIEDTIKTLKHLFIGNSFSNNARKWLWEIADSAGFDIIKIGNIYKGGCSLETHSDYAANNTAGYTYYKIEDGSTRSYTDSTMLRGILDEDWMTISFQQASTDSGKPETYEPFLTNLMAYVDENKTNPDAKYVWHMTWAYAQDKVPSKYEKDQMYMYNAIVNAVQTKVLTKDAIEIVIPSGTAIQNARTSTVGDTLNSDGTHLEETHGCYIAGLMTFKALTGADLADVTYDSGFTHENFLAIAKESVNNAYAKPFEVTKSAYAPTTEEPDEPVVPEEPEVVVDALSLTDIKIDGVTVAEFRADVTEYTHVLTVAQIANTDAPVVTYTLADETSSAVVVNPTAFPGKVTITVTAADGSEREYVVNYDSKNAVTNITPDAEATTKASYVPGGIKMGGRVASDRAYDGTWAINMLIDELDGQDAVITPVSGWVDVVSTFSFDLGRDAVITILQNKPKFMDPYIAIGFVKNTDSTNNKLVIGSNNGAGQSGNDIREYKHMSTKEFAAGKVTLPFTKPNMPVLTAIKMAPWGGFEEEEPDTPVVPDEPEEEAMVNSISIDGEEIADFDEETLEYTVALTEDQIAAESHPEVTYDVAEGAEVVVTNPVSFPGFAEIKVTKGEETKTYKVTYDVPLLTVNLSSEAPQGTPGVAVVKGVNVGDKNFNDRTTFPIEAINDDTITADTLKIKTCIGWQTDQKDYATLYKGTAINDWLSFTAPRAMVVTVYEDNAVNSSKFNYWTTETSSDVPYILATASNSLKYTTRHRRVYEAGEVVEIPNAVGNRTFAVTVNYLNWNEEAPELDVVIPIIKKISYSDLVPKVTSGENANVEPGMWNGLAIYKTTKYQLSKEFADITEPTEITITTDKIAKGYGIIVVAPLNETDDKNVIVNPDGSDLEWEDYEGVVIDYNYTNGGNEDFDPANATFVQRNNTAATFSGGTAYVYNAMNNSDDMYITGSALATTRNPYTGELHWTDLPEEYLGCNYIVVPFDGGFNGGERTFTFTVDQPVKVWVHSSSSNMTVTDTIDDTQWTASQCVVTRRFQNVLDHLSCAYMLKKGYVNESNIVLYGKVGGSNGVRFNRYDVYENLKADCGTYLGWAIDPEKVEATGFTNTINDYRYEEYLEAWVD